MSSAREMEIALEYYVTCDQDNLERAWDRLARSISRENLRMMADAARAAHQALEKQLEMLEELMTGSGPLLPVIRGLDGNRFVVSTGRGDFDWVTAAPDPETGQPILDADELEQRGPALAALDRSGAVIVDVHWPDEDLDLFLLILGTEEAHVAEVDDHMDGPATGDQLQIPVDEAGPQ